MAKNKSESGSKKDSPTTSRSIQKQTQEYLDNGGRINIIKTGVTGFDRLKTSRHINISGNKRQS